MTKKNKSYVIGLTGKNASGKGSLGHILQKWGYAFCSLSDILRHHLKQQNQEDSRNNLMAMGRQLREKSGPGVLASQLLEQGLQEFQVVDSFRHPAEVEIFKSSLENFKLISIEAPEEIRFKRAQARGRNENVNSLEEFINKEKLESSSNQNAQQLEKTIALADFKIENSSDLNAIETQLLQIIQGIQFPTPTKN